MALLPLTVKTDMFVPFSSDNVCMIDGSIQYSGVSASSLVHEIWFSVVRHAVEIDRVSIYKS